jgi:hypothetical protein
MLFSGLVTSRDRSRTSMVLEQTPRDPSREQTILAKTANSETNSASKTTSTTKATSLTSTAKAHSSLSGVTASQQNTIVVVHLQPDSCNVHITLPPLQGSLTTDCLLGLLTKQTVPFTAFPTECESTLAYCLPYVSILNFGFLARTSNGSSTRVMWSAEPDANAIAALADFFSKLHEVIEQHVSKSTNLTSETKIKWVIPTPPFVPESIVREVAENAQMLDSSRAQAGRASGNDLATISETAAAFAYISTKVLPNFAIPPYVCSPACSRLFVLDYTNILMSI